jgi:hypothetical protein
MKKELKNPNKADLDKDGVLTSYEKKRGMAIEEAMNASQGKFSSKPDVIDFNKKKAQKNPGFETKILRTKKELSKEVEKTQKAKKIW